MTETYVTLPFLKIDKPHWQGRSKDFFKGGGGGVALNVNF